jgi:hypothetical protein
MPHSRQPAASTKNECEVTAKDLAHLEEVKKLLKALNDSYAAVDTLRVHIERIPVLSARCIRRAQVTNPARKVTSLAYALGLIGNRGLGSELMEFLEDLTWLKATM